ncbi:MAG TPA: aldo/keto reductase [Dehalococcoidia bacterium]|nr:aldo/keto reductase [Dehalococcoidia bacterium]
MADLPTCQLGRTGLRVTALGFGAMELRGAPRGRPVQPDQAQTVLNAVLDAGINYIDTSIDYGQSEEFIGQFIAGRRGEYFLASKCGCLVGAPPAPAGQRNPHDFSRENIIAGVNQSLARMKTDYLDVVQFHASPSAETLAQQGAIETLRDLQREGKIRFLGMSSTLPNIEQHVDMGVFDVFQIPYSATDRQHEAVVTRAGEAGAGIVIRGGVARGAVSAEGQASDAARTWEQAQLDDLLEGMSRQAFMLRFTLSHPQLDTTIVGTLNPEHLLENLAAAQAGPLRPDVYEEAKRRLAAAGSTPAA